MARRLMCQRPHRITGTAQASGERRAASHAGSPRNAAKPTALRAVGRPASSVLRYRAAFGSPCPIGSTVFYRLDFGVAARRALVHALIVVRRGWLNEPKPPRLPA
jgi:hypothetical protein